MATINLFTDAPTGIGQFAYITPAAGDPGSGNFTLATGTSLEISDTAGNGIDVGVLLDELSSGTHIHLYAKGEARTYSVTSIADNTSYHTIAVAVVSSSTGFALTLDDEYAVQLLVGGAISGVIDAGQITTGTLDPNRITSAGVTQHQGDISHDSTLGALPDEHHEELHTVDASRVTGATAGAGVKHLATDTGALAISDGTDWVASGILPQNSLEVTAGTTTAPGKIQLANDETSPGNDKVYGTTGAGVKGWKNDPAGGSGVTGPATSVVGRIAIWDDTTGDSIENTNASVTGSGGVTVGSNVTNGGASCIVGGNVTSGTIEATGNAPASIAFGRTNNASAIIKTESDGAIATGFVGSANTIHCTTSADGSRAHGLANGGDIIASALGARAYGSAAAAGSINAEGEGSLASGYAGLDALTASGRGSVALGSTLATGDIIASAENSFQLGPGTNAEATSLCVGDITSGGMRLIGDGAAAASPQNGDVYSDGTDVFIRSGGAARNMTTAGGGGVAGPTTSTIGNVAIWDDATGDSLENTVASITASGGYQAGAGTLTGAAGGNFVSAVSSGTSDASVLAPGALLWGQATGSGSTINVTADGGMAGGRAATGGDILASGAASCARGNTLTSNACTASGIASTALSYGTQNVTASGNASFVMAASFAAAASSSGDNSMQIGPGTNTEATSICVGDITSGGIRLIGDGAAAASPQNGDVYSDGTDVFIRSGGAARNMTTAGGGVTTDGTTTQDAVFIQERSANVNTPVSGKAEIWVSDEDQPGYQRLKWTNDDDIDYDIMSGSGTSLEWDIPYFADASGVKIKSAGGAGSFSLEGGNQFRLSMTDANIRMKECAAFPDTAAVASYGYMWVRSDDPANLMFTDDDENHYKVVSRLIQPVRVASPSASENVSMFYTNVAITVTQITSVIQGSTSVSFDIEHGTSRATATGTGVIGTDVVCNNTTTGIVTTSFTDATIPADSFVWLSTSALDGTPTELSVTVEYTED